MVAQDSEGGRRRGDARVEEWAGRGGGKAAHLAGRPGRKEVTFFSLSLMGTEEGERGELSG